MSFSILNIVKVILIYIFDSDLVWQMQLMIIKGKNSCCIFREFLTFNAYELDNQI